MVVKLLCFCLKFIVIYIYSYALLHTGTDDGTSPYAKLLSLILKIEDLKRERLLLHSHRMCFFTTVCSIVGLDQA